MKKGFTLLEILVIVVVLCIIFLLAIPIMRMVISNSEYGTFENSVYNAIDAVDLYIVNHEWTKIPDDGLEISVLDSSILHNNNFEEGVFVREDKKVRMIYIKQGDYCAKGTKEKLEVTNKGCGALDETAPTKVDLFLKNSTKNKLIIAAGGYDPDSKIVKYELSVDGGEYYTNNNVLNNVFEVKVKDESEHTFKVRVTNEGGKVKESKVKKFKLEPANFTLYEKKGLENVQSKKIFNFKKEKGTTYEYSEDLINWEQLDKTLTVSENKIIYFRLTKDNDITYHTLSVQDIDTELNGAYPDLDEDMIPVIYENGKWLVANRNAKYYDYAKGQYANVVLVRKHKDYNDDDSNSRSYYLSDEAIGGEIHEPDIIAFYVWIPKYRYQIWNANGGTELKNVEIVFENKKSAKKSGIKNGDWATHDAFTYLPENGFWVSKYQASVSTELNCYLSPSKNTCNSNTYDLYSLPGRKIINYVSSANASQMADNLNKKFNIYGLSEEVIPHLMTNLEWGAIVYLKNSKYAFNEITGPQIGNIGEYVMGNYNYDSGLNRNDNSGFTPDGNTEWPKHPYIDIYKSISLKGYKLGDATLELNIDVKNYINGEKPFIIRGIDNITGFTSSSGSAIENISFRPVIAKAKIEK